MYENHSSLSGQVNTCKKLVVTVNHIIQRDSTKHQTRLRSRTENDLTVNNIN